MIIKTSFLLLPPRLARRPTAVSSPPRPVVLLTEPMAPPAAASAGVDSPPTETGSRSAVLDFTAHHSHEEDNTTKTMMMNKNDDDDTSAGTDDDGPGEDYNQGQGAAQEAGLAAKAEEELDQEQGELLLSVHSFVTPKFSGSFSNGHATGFVSEAEFDADAEAAAVAAAAAAVPSKESKEMAAPPAKRQRSANVSFSCYRDLCSFLDGGDEQAQSVEDELEVAHAAAACGRPMADKTQDAASSLGRKRKRSEDADGFISSVLTMRDLVAPPGSTSPLSSSDSSDMSDSEDSCTEDDEPAFMTGPSATPVEEKKRTTVALDECDLEENAFDDPDAWDAVCDALLLVEEDAVDATVPQMNA